jgi:hypothetical protein
MLTLTAFYCCVVRIVLNCITIPKQYTSFNVKLYLMGGFCNVFLCGFCNVRFCVGFVMCGCFGNMYTVLFLNLTEIFLTLTEVFSVLFPQL